jgi:DNA-binding NtrC family response regulator
MARRVSSDPGAGPGQTGHPRVLLASNDLEYATGLTHFLESEAFQVDRCHDSKGVLRLAGLHDYAVAVLDLDLADEAGLDLITFIRRQRPDTQVVLVFDVARLEKAIEGLRRGAFFYLPKSAQPSDVVLAVNKAVRDAEVRAALHNHEQQAFEELVGNTPAMRRVVELIQKVAPTDSTVLLLGESGTGKEVVANTIHRLSSRRDRPFIAVNCAALPEQILESELFGHVKGAFTGAESDKSGLFEEADGGTLFLDEAGDMALVSQAKLLRVLQSGEIRRVGDTNVRHVDVRILAATNRDLIDDVREKRFREDLYFRLNVIQIVIPPLRERPDAIAALTREFLKRYNRKYGKAISHIDDPAWALLQAYSYPGNVRELESTLAHAVIMADENIIRLQDLPDAVRLGQGGRLGLPHLRDSRALPSLQEMEKQLIERALATLNGNQTEVAKTLGISRSTLWRKLKEYNIAKPAEDLAD